jgi:hypothetical protein
MTRKGSSLLPRLIVLSFLFASQVGLARTQEPANKSSDQDQSVRLKTELVELRAVVTDKKGNPIGDLKKEDFEVLENGVPQEIGFFSGSTPESLSGGDIGSKMHLFKVDSADRFVSPQTRLFERGCASRDAEDAPA